LGHRGSKPFKDLGEKPTKPIKLPKLPPLPKPPKDRLATPPRQKKNTLFKVYDRTNKTAKLGLYGWLQFGAHLEPNPKEFPTLIELRLLSAEGMFCRDIAAKLNEEGLKNRDGFPWSAPEIASILSTCKEAMMRWRDQAA
jgi:hypothetical protein